MNEVHRILIVEDQSDDYELVQHEIHKIASNCVFERVEKQTDFLKALQDFQPDIILSDDALPGFNSMEVLKLAQQQSSFVPVIIQTERKSEDVAVEYMKRGASNYIIKDNLKRLGPAVVQALKERKAISEHKQAEEKYQAIFENSPVGIFQSTPHGQFISVNPAMAHIYGYSSPAEMVNSITDIAQQIYAAPEERYEFTNLLETHDVVKHYEWKNTRKDGSIFWTSTSARAVRDESGNILYYEGFLQDITDRKLAEEKLAEREKRFRALIENGMDNISLLAKDGTLLWEDSSLNTGLGYERGEYVGRSLFQLMHPQDVAWTSELFAKVVDVPRSQHSGTFRLKHRDGSWRWIEATATNMLEEPSVNAVVINYRDITERKKAEEELQESQTKYQNLVETSHDLIWSVNAEGRITFLNHAAKDIYGYEPEELIGRSFFELMDPESHYGDQEMFKERIANRHEYQGIESYVRHKDGRQIILSANAIVMRDENGNMTGVVGSSRDITERKQVEEILREERNLLRTLIDNLPDRIYAMDQQGRKTLSNIADWKASGGKMMEDVIGKTDFDMYPPELAEPFWQIDKMVLDSGQPIINFEEPGLDFEGNPVSILTTKIPLRDDEGKVIGLVGVGRDITERKQVEARINDLLSLNEKMLNNSQLGILTYKLTGECVFANQNAASIVGTSIENLISQNFHAIEAWKKSGLYALVEQASSTRNVATGDIHVVSTFGKDIWMTANCTVFTSKSEEHVLLSIADITERKQAQEKLLHSQQELTEAQRIARIGSWSFDLAKDEVHWSDELYRIFGVEPENFAHTYDAFLDIIHPDDRSRVKRSNTDALDMGSSFEVEYRIITTGSEVKFISEVGYAVKANDGKTIGLFGTAQDITQRKQTEIERQALLDIMQGLAYTKDLQEMLKLVHHSLGNVIYAENFFVVLHQQESGLFEEIYSVDQYDPPAPPSMLEKSITSYIFRSGEPLLLTNESFNKLVEQNEFELVGTNSASWLGVPLKTSNGTIGVIAVQDYQDPYRYSDHDKDFLASIASQVALAIERKQADIELKQKNDDLALLNTVNEAVIGGQNLDSTIELLSTELRRIFSTVGCTVYLLSTDKRSITMQQYSFSTETAQKVEKLLGFTIPKIQIPIMEGGHFHNAMVAKRSAITSDPQKIQDWLAEFVETRFLPPITRAAARKLIPHIYKLLNIKSTIVVPLLSEDEVIGFLDVSSSNLFTESDLKRIETFGEQLTAVIQRQQANEKIRRSEQFLQGVQNSFSAHVAILNQQGNIIQVNAAWCGFGEQNGLQDANCCIGENYLDICESATGPEAQIAQQVAAGIREILSGKRKEVSVEYPCHSPSEKRWFTVHITCFDDGEQRWVILAHENITTRMVAEAALQESTAQLRSLFEATPDAIMLIDPNREWIIVDCNSAACKINGYAREELIGKPVDILNTVRSTVASNAEYFKQIQDTDVLHYETLHVRKDGTIFPIEVSTSLIQLGDRNMVLGINRDITERKRVEAAEREQRDLAEALRDTAQILSSSLDYGEVLDHILTTVGRVVPHDAATIMLIEGESAQVVRLEGYEKRDINHEITGIKLPLAETSNLRQMLETKQPVVVYDTYSYTGWKRMAATEWLRSNVGAPISIYGEVIGFILLDSETPGFFTPAHAEHLGAFADQAALAIHNAHLLQQAQEEIAERTRAEEEFRQSENRYRTVVESQTEFIVRWKPDGIRTFVNEAYCRYYGITVEYALSSDFMPLIFEEDRPAIEEKVSRLLSGITSVETESHRVLKPDGTIGWNEWTDHAIYDENGQLIEFQSVGRDITERKQAEQDLLASEERFRQLANNIEEVFWMTDAQTGKELYINPAGEKIWGLSLDYLMHEPDAFIEIVSPEDKQRVLNYIEKEKHGEKVEMEYRIQRADGSIHWIWDRAFPLFDENGAVKTLAGIATDITDRKLAEMILQQSQARYYGLFESSPISLWEEDYSLVKKRIEELQQSGLTNLEEYLSNHREILLELASLVKVLDVNRASMELYHARQKEDLVKNLLDFVSEETLQHFQNEILGLMSPTARFTWEGADQRLDGEELIVVVNGSIPPGYEGNWSKVIISINDITERKQVEDKLRASEERYHGLFQNLVDGFALHEIITDDRGKPVDYRFLEINPAFEKLTGLKAQNTVGRRVNEVLPSIGNERLISIYGQVALTGQPAHFEEYSAALGKHYEIDAYSPRHRQFAVTFVDVTERKLAEEKLRMEQRKAQNYLDIADVIMLVLDQAGAVSLINQKGCEILGYSSDEIIGRNWIQTFLPADEREKLQQVFEQLSAGDVPPVAYYENSVLTKSGEKRTVAWHNAVIQDSDGQIIGTLSSGEDITERKRTEEALRESEARFGSAFEFAPIGIALVSIDGKWVKVNQALCELLGYTEQELMRKTFQEITHPDDLEADLHFVHQTIKGEIISYQMEKRYFHKSGNIVWTLLSVSLVKDNEGKPQYFISQIQDITERKRAEEEINRHAKETSALLETSLALTNLELKSILESVGNSAKTLFAGDGCRIFLMQPDGETLRCVLVLQENFTAFSDLRIKLGEGVTGSVAANGRAEIVNAMQNDPRAVQVPGTQEREEESIMFAPLKERERTIGVISIRRAGAEQPFQTADLELLEAFASMAASAVSNARLFEEAQQRLSELEALYENGLAVGQLLKPREIGERMIETFARYLSWHHVTIRLLRPDTDELELIAFNVPGLDDDKKTEMEHYFNAMIQRTGQGLSGEVAGSGLPLRTGNVHLYPQYVYTQAGIESGLYMPLKLGDQIIGVISVESETPDAFSEQDERLLATLANQAAIAFENARLYQAAHEEILERTRAQAALWASETHYRELADSITDILFEMDHELRYTHWNKASEMFSGIPAEDAIGKPIQDLFETSEEQSKRETIYSSVLTERQAKTFETEIFSKAKEEKRVLEINAYPSTRGVSVVARDITERKLDESLMQKRFGLMEYSAHHSLEELMQKTIDEISLLTESHIGFMHFVEEDQKTLSLQAWSSETIQTMGKVEEKESHYPMELAGIWADALRQRRSVIQNDYASLPDKKGLPDGHVKVIRELVIPIIRDEKIAAVLGIGNKPKEYTQRDIEIAERFADYAWDIIERRQMESALSEERNQLAMRVEDRTADLSRANSNLARALRVKDEFLANMSHELRTPLNAILGLSESLSEQIAGPLNEKQQKYLNTINESGHHLLSLINDILDLAKIEAGQITLDINKVDVNSVCQASLRMIKQLAQKKNQEVIFEIDGDVGLMWADERRLKQMIVNLLSNAVKFTPEAGKFGLEVHGDQAGNRVLITVWDKGIGISDHDMERLFKPFVQLDSGLAREASGTGLGLALVAQMARLHGGSVNVESQMGGGSRFTIQLPWEPALAADTATRLRSTGKFRAIDIHATNKPTILLIEDTLEVVMMLVDYLEMTGFKIVTAQDGIEGLEQAKLTHPDLILMDIQMPRMDGFEATQKLRMDSQFKDTPIIALTALAMPNDRQRCLEAGMDEYISKPVNLKALVKLIRSILLGKEGKPT